MDTAQPIAIKPHHFIDILTDVGRGHTDWHPVPEYGHALHAVAHRLMADRDALIRIEHGIDDICRPCVHHVDGRCDDGRTRVFAGQPASKMAWNLTLDRRWSELLGLPDGQELTARQFCHIALRCLSPARALAIYREQPPAQVDDRYRHLVAGLKEFCGEGGP